jgi:hypothetical protein
MEGYGTRDVELKGSSTRMLPLVSVKIKVRMG